MKRQPERLQNELFDLIIVGGGIIGSGIARDAALRGLSTLLVEKEDFACGTTSRSSRLIHGGLRYLRSLQWRLVRYDLKEREILLRIAPHLVRRLPFIIPLPRTETFYRISLPFGLWLYDLLAIDQQAPRWKKFAAAAALELEPALRGIKNLSGAYGYTDCEAGLMERLCLENLLEAAQKGACILNYASATGITKSPSGVMGIEIQDMLTGARYSARGRRVINATGHWADLVWKQFQVKTHHGLRKTKGIHLVTPKLSEKALVLFAKSDGRLFFVIPWEDFSLIGTTDTDYAGDADRVYATAQDVDYLVKETARYFPGFDHSRILYTQAGLRPLVGRENISASATSRAHRILDHASSGFPGLITVLGGKITAHRGIAEEAVDRVCRQLEVSARCITDSALLPGAPAVSLSEKESAAAVYGLPVDTIHHLASIYGSQFTRVLDATQLEPRIKQPVCTGRRDILAQIKWAVENESAVTIADFMLRRSLMGFAADQGQAAVDTVAAEMAGYLKWDSSERQKQIDSYSEFVKLGQMWRNGTS
ncbi:MAG TPA: glycerol-3-phosphate dehydrogenase/oxidase [Dehalococcoidales bacterium]|nr:glycerol-3-phosphate dehydrogenase/oxidase [Dehalococcoidales bacterium]